MTANAAKPVRERLTLIRIFEELRELGYDGEAISSTGDGQRAVRAPPWKKMVGGA